eukprot:UN14884
MFVLALFKRVEVSPFFLSKKRKISLKAFSKIYPRSCPLKKYCSFCSFLAFNDNFPGGL